MTKQRLLHQPRPVPYDSGIMSRVLDDFFDASLDEFALTHEYIITKRAVFISQTVLFELQPVLRVLKNRYPAQALRVE